MVKSWGFRTLEPLIYQLTTRVGILTKGNAPTVCCFLKIQAPSGGRKQNCRFISVYTTTDPNILFGFSTVLLYNRTVVLYNGSTFLKGRYKLVKNA